MSSYNSLLTAMKNMNIKVDQTIERFVGNTDLYVKFSVKYSLENRMPDIFAAYDAKSTDDLIMLVHKLKGASGNLGIDDIYFSAEEVIKQLRSGSYDGVKEMLDDISKKYSDICHTIQENTPKDFDPNMEIKV